MHRLLSAILFTAIASHTTAGSAATESYTIDPNVTLPQFEVSHAGFTPLRGHFAKTSGKIHMDRERQTGTLDLTIDTTSLTMGSSAWTANLKDEGLFNVAKYPTMTYHLEKMIFQGDKVVGATGQLTLVGVTRPVAVDVNNFKCGTHPEGKRALCAAEVSAVLKRSDFGMTKYLNSVSDEVKVSVPVEAYRD